MWLSPVGLLSVREEEDYLPTSFHVVEALEAFGLFTIEGLKIMAEVWGR